MPAVAHSAIACHLHNTYNLQTLIHSAITIGEEFYVDNVLKDIVPFLGLRDVRNVPMDG